MEGGAHRSPYTYYEPCYCALQLQPRRAAEAAPTGCAAAHPQSLPTRAAEHTPTGRLVGSDSQNLRGQVLRQITVRPFRRL